MTADPVGSETDFVHALLVRLCDSGRVLVWRQNAGTALLGTRGAIRAGTPGMSDVLGVTTDGRARLVSYEIKGPDARWKKSQRAWLARVRALGGVAADYRINARLGREGNLAAATRVLLAALEGS